MIKDSIKIFEVETIANLGRLKRRQKEASQNVFICLVTCYFDGLILIKNMFLKICKQSERPLSHFSSLTDYYGM